MMRKPAATIYWIHKMYQTLCLPYTHNTQFNSHTNPYKGKNNYYLYFIDEEADA